MPRDLRPDIASQARHEHEHEHEHDERSTDQKGWPSITKTHIPQSVLEKLHPYVQTLSIADLDSCVLLEEAVFPPQERCTREKFEYRFRVCGELCLGLFSSLQHSTLDTAQAALPVESQDPQRKAVLLAQVVATKSASNTVTDDDMAMPSTTDPDPSLGHKEHGRTVCIHSLAVLPVYQRSGLGTNLLTAYLDRLRASGAADRVAIIAHDHLIGYYERFGFESLGPSGAQFGGGGWYDMVLTL